MNQEQLSALYILWRKRDEIERSIRRLKTAGHYEEINMVLNDIGVDSAKVVAAFEDIKNKAVQLAQEELDKLSNYLTFLPEVKGVDDYLGLNKEVNHV